MVLDLIRWVQAHPFPGIYVIGMFYTSIEGSMRKFLEAKPWHSIAAPAVMSWAWPTWSLYELIQHVQNVHAEIQDEKSKAQTEKAS
jgi:hypothetical protein